jgi:hypothetical protein
LRRENIMSRDTSADQLEILYKIKEAVEDYGNKWARFHETGESLHEVVDACIRVKKLVTEGIDLAKLDKPTYYDCDFARYTRNW